MAHEVSTSRKIAIAVDLSDESAYSVKWAVANYLREGDIVILLHVRPTSVLYGADWGAIDLSLLSKDEQAQQKLEDDFAAFTSSKASDMAQPLIEANIPFRIHIVKDHDMKERICLEAERLGVSAVIMGSRGFGASAARRSYKSRLGSVSDYCVHHCVCPVVVVRFPDDSDSGGAETPAPTQIDVLHEVAEEEEIEDEDENRQVAEDEDEGQQVAEDETKDVLKEKHVIDGLQTEEQETDVDGVVKENLQTDNVEEKIKHT